LPPERRLHARHRRRALLLLSLALVTGGMAASSVRSRVREVEAQVGPLVPVVVAVRDLGANVRLSGGRIHRALEVRRVPQRFVPRDAASSLEELVGARTAVPLKAGAYVSISELDADGSRAPGGAVAMKPGERAVAVEVTTADALGEVPPGTRVDVVVSSGEGSEGRSFVALADVELLTLRAGGIGQQRDEGERGPRSTATLRVTLSQAISLTAASNFAHEVRLLARPPGDHGAAPREPAGVGSG
jgi:pilus assembly protein CpaB